MLDFFIASVQLDPIAMVKTGSYLGIALIVFAESGLLIGIFPRRFAPFRGRTSLCRWISLSRTAYLCRCDCRNNW